MRAVRQARGVGVCAAVGLLLGGGTIRSQEVHRAPAPGGEVATTSAAEQQAYEQYHYAFVRRAGDWVYVSGTVVRRPENGGKDAAAFKEECRTAFRRIGALLTAEGAGFANVTMINSFHVWNGPDLYLKKPEQFQAFGAAKDEFFTAPYPAWTAVGTTELLGNRGIVEVQVIAYAPRHALKQ